MLPTTVEAVAEVTGRSRGIASSELFAARQGRDAPTRWSTAAPGDDLRRRPADRVMLVTAQGVMKRLSVGEVVGTPAGKPVIKLKTGDSVVAAFHAPDGVEVVAVASNAQALRCEAAIGHRCRAATPVVWRA